MRQLRPRRRLNWRGFGIAVALYVLLGAALAGVGSSLGDDIGPWVSGAVGAGLVTSLGALFGWRGYGRGIFDGPGGDGTLPRRRWWRSAFFLVLAAVELWFAITQIVADPAVWGAYVLLVVGIVFLVVAFHPASRAGLD